MAKCLRCGAGSEWIEGRVPIGAPSDNSLPVKVALDAKTKRVEELEAEVQFLRKERSRVLTIIKTWIPKPEKPT